MNTHMIIALDGPGGAGKSTLAKAIAKELGILYVDTGALYRTVGLFALQNGVDPKNSAAVNDLLPKINIELCYVEGAQTILLNGVDVKDSIRTPDASMAASAVSAIPEVRAFLLDMQRRTAETSSVIMDGRDIGTVIFPKADVKIFLTASPAARAKRRYHELLSKGSNVTYEEVLRDMETRDRNDSTRDIAPLRPAEDAILFDNSKLDFEKTLAKALTIIDKKQKKNAKLLRKKSHGTPIDRFFHFLLAGFFRFIYRIRVIGKENIPEVGGAVLCSNHIAIRDVFVIAAAIDRQPRYLAKSELFKIPVISSLIRMLGATPVTRNGKDVGAVKTMISLAKDEGALLTVFPQGTRRAKLNPADTTIKNGVAMVAYRADVPMIPLCIKTKDVSYSLFRRVEVIVGKPIDPVDAGLVSGGTEEYSAAAKLVFDEICALGGYTPTALPVPQKEEETAAPVSTPVDEDKNE